MGECEIYILKKKTDGKRASSSHHLMWSRPAPSCLVRLLELQGNIRVLARVRPILEVSEGARRERLPFLPFAFPSFAVLFHMGKGSVFCAATNGLRAEEGRSPRPSSSGRPHQDCPTSMKSSCFFPVFSRFVFSVCVCFFLEHHHYHHSPHTYQVRINYSHFIFIALGFASVSIFFFFSFSFLF